MKGIQLLLIPVTAAWIVGGLWWVGQQSSCGCAPLAGNSTGAASASIIHIGPTVADGSMARTEALQPTDPVPPEAAAAIADHTRVPSLVIPFVKNEQELELSGDVQQWCDAVRTHLMAHPELSIKVTGHTDADGDAELNKRLSLRRAEIVKARLVDLGLPVDRITPIGVGADEPIADNLTSAGKAMNRRVEIHVGP